MGSRRIAVALACAALLVATAASAAPRGARATGHDWTRFGWTMSRTSAPTFATGITAGNVRSLVRKQVQLDGTVDSSADLPHGVQVGGAAHDTFFVTTTYGKTEAIDASSGAVLWRYTPPGYSSWAGSAQITTATPVADPGRAYIYAAVARRDDREARRRRRPRRLERLDHAPSVAREDRRVPELQRAAT